MTTAPLLAEIRLAFPPVAMPRGLDLRYHRDDCYHCDYLAKALEERRGKPVDGAVIRLLHQEMSCLSANGWVWALHHYLPFCLTPEAEYNQMETEFLVYNLAPSEKFKAETLRRLSALNRQQVNCLIHFVEWLQGQPQWQSYCPDEIDKALAFLNAIDA